MSDKEQYDGVLDGAPPSIPPGSYEAIYTHHETSLVFNTAKVFVHFKVVEGEHTGVKLYRAYRVKSLRGKPRRNGSFKVGHSHDLFRDYVSLMEAKERPDRISLRRLKGCVLTIKVRTVKKDYRQRELIPLLFYSVVDSIEGLVAGAVNAPS